MSLYDSKTWISDLDEVISSFGKFKELEGKRIMITGATGLICSAVVDLLIRWNETNTNKIEILAAGRNEAKFRERFGEYCNEQWFKYIEFDANKLDNTSFEKCDYIIHGASNASPNKIINEPVETMMSNFIGTKSILDYARDNHVGRVLFISSSEVYGRKEKNEPSKIDDYGYIDLLNPRNSYSIGKCAAETLCASYYAEYNVDSVIVRPGHIYGPTAQKSDARVSSAWAYDAAEGRDIVMKSEGAQIRSYVYCLDCATAILTVLLRGEKGKAYNISNPNSVISIKTIAETLSTYFKNKLLIELPSDKEIKGFNPMLDSSLDSRELCDIGWKGLYDYKKGFMHTVHILKEAYK